MHIHGIFIEIYSAVIHSLTERFRKNFTQSIFKLGKFFIFIIANGRSIVGKVFNLKDEISSVSAIQKGRDRSGWPGATAAIRWLSPDSRPEFPKDEKAEAFVKKFTNIPTLSTYNTEPDEQFWDNFPKRGLPMKPETVINIENLQIAIEESKSNLYRT